MKGKVFVSGFIIILFSLCLWPVLLGGMFAGSHHHHMAQTEDDCLAICFISSLQLIDTLKSELSFLPENFALNYLFLILALGLLVFQIKSPFASRNFLSPPNFISRQRLSFLTAKINDRFSLALAHGLINPKLYS